MLPAAASTADVNDPPDSDDARTRGGGDDACSRGGTASGDAAREASDPLRDIDLLRRGFCTFDRASIWSYTVCAFSHVRVRSQ